ncbi:MAG: virulence protein RhuM/Fic/DOC family protein [Candidatus Yonathbacteria bacterium]|nr:virulence protein RhuM/Fic/DOC family protein [Candidatus Yonathbacteria bacterium]
MKPQKIKKEVVIYQAKSGAIELRGDFGRETVWATQDQVAELFSTTKQNISLHFKNIFKSKELDQSSVVKDFLTTATDGKKYKVKSYNLDAILSVGYRVNSRQATSFRQWVTSTLRKHLVEGYTLNRTRISKNYDAFLQAVADVKALLPVGAMADTKDILELVTLFADTWLSLDAYDKDALVTKGATKKSVKITAEMFEKSLASLKESLIEKGEATDLFATERERGILAGIIGNVMQTFGGQEMYLTVEEKAAHFLYFVIKNHPFLDGNKRSGAYAFVWFLAKAKVLDIARITPPALTAITLLIAESDPAHKDKMVGLILTMLAKKRK